MHMNGKQPSFGRPSHCSYKGCMVPMSDSAFKAEDNKWYCCVLCSQRGMHYDRVRQSPPELQLVLPWGAKR
jgi:hypothetical protein